VADTARRTGLDEAAVRAWYPAIGDADHLAGLIESYVEAGMEYVVVNLPNAFEVGVLSRFAEEVFPRLGLTLEPKPA